MKKLLLFVLAICLFSLSSILTAIGADSTSFDPTTVQVKAKGSGGVPVGTIMAWPVAKNPSDMSNWLECKGQSITQAAYPELFAVVGAKVPDLRGYFLRGVGGNSAALGVSQGDAIRNISGSFNSRVAGMRGPVTGPFREGEFNSQKVAVDGGTYPSTATFDASRVVPTANENRPLNKAVRYLIRARP